MEYVYRSLVTPTKLIRQSAAAATNADGSITQIVVINGETAVCCHRDGSLQRGWATGSNDPYLPGWGQAPWETLAPQPMVSPPLSVPFTPGVD